jgi:hypothetical protein
MLFVQWNVNKIMKYILLCQSIKSFHYIYKEFTFRRQWLKIVRVGTKRGANIKLTITEGRLIIHQLSYCDNRFYTLISIH